MNWDEKSTWVEVGDGVFWTRGTTCTNCGERKQRYQGTRQDSVAGLRWGGGAVEGWIWDGAGVCSYQESSPASRLLQNGEKGLMKAPPPRPSCQGSQVHMKVSCMSPHVNLQVADPTVPQEN